MRLGAGLAGIGLLGLGTLLMRLAPDQWQIGELCRGLAAAVVGVPTLVSGLRGIVTGDTRRATDQLVAIAVLAAAASGDFVTATLIPLFLEVGRLFEERSSLGARAAIDGIRALGARQAVQLARRRRGARRSRTASCRATRSSSGRASGSPSTARCSKGAPRSISRRSPASRCTRTSGPGSPVFAGTVALDGLLTIQVRGAGADTVLGRVVQLLAEVERDVGARAPAVRAARRRVAAAGAHPRRRPRCSSPRISRARSPCSSSRRRPRSSSPGPAAVVAAMTVATRLRILIKSADFLERASDVDTLILDKTGTVTVGAPAVTEIRPAAGESEETLLRGRGRRAASARCIRCRAPSSPRRSRAASRRRRPRDLQERPGLGVVAIGRRRSRPSSAAGRCSTSSASTVGVEDDEDVSQVWVALRTAAASAGSCCAISRAPRRAKRSPPMRALGIDRLILLTGDRAAAAREVGDALGMDEVDRRGAAGAEARGRARGAGGGPRGDDGRRRRERRAGARRRRRRRRDRRGAQRGRARRRRCRAARHGSRPPAAADRAGRRHASVIGQNVWLAFGLSVVLIALAARGVLDPLTGALAQSVAVLAVVANSARILRRGTH